MIPFRLSKQAKQLTLTLLMSTLLSVVLYLARAVAAESLRYWFLNWNLFLAWLPLLFAWLLKERLKTQPWLSWPNLLLTLLWLCFLPNSFYLLSDFIHLHESGEVSLLYDIVLFMSFTWNGFLLGFISLYIIHRELLKKIRRRDVNIIIYGVLLLCGFAIYIGRYQRWNTWDVLVNPAGLLFSVSDRLINSGSHPQLFTTTLMFFVLLASMYAFVWRTATIIGLNASK